MNAVEIEEAVTELAEKPFTATEFPYQFLAAFGNKDTTIKRLRGAIHRTIRDVIHKIGVTGGDVAKRIANAKLDPNFHLADVEIVATYKLFNIGRTKLGNLIHRIFEPTRLDIEIKDRFGNPVVPREWFLVPLFVIDDAVEKIKDGTITGYVYDPSSARLVERGAPPPLGDLT